MQTPVRYYITCDDDRPVVRTIPVAVHDRQPDEVNATADVQDSSSTNGDREPSRVRKLARAKVARRRARTERE